MAIKWFKSPYCCVILPMTQPQMAKQQQKKNYANSEINQTFPIKISVTFSIRHAAQINRAFENTSKKIFGDKSSSDRHII